MKLSDLIIEYRTRMNISQREFSRKCDLSNTYISFIENEKNPKTGRPVVPTLEQYKKLADGMGISVQRLFELLDDDAPVDLGGSSSETSVTDLPEDNDFRLFVRDSSKLSPDQFRMARSLLRAAFRATNPELFKGDDDK